MLLRVVIAQKCPYPSLVPATTPRALAAPAAAPASAIGAGGSSRARCDAAAAAAKPSGSPRALTTSACLSRLRCTLPPHVHLRLAPLTHARHRSADGMRSEWAPLARRWSRTRREKARTKAATCADGHQKKLFRLRRREKAENGRRTSDSMTKGAGRAYPLFPSSQDVKNHTIRLYSEGKRFVRIPTVPLCGSPKTARAPAPPSPVKETPERPVS